MDVNNSVWARYQPGYVTPEFIPYLREQTTDAWGNQVEINNWKRSMPSSTVQPELVRMNLGMRFQRLFEVDPCPPGWKKDPNELAYCIPEELRHEPVFYTNKAFIPLKQYFNGSAESGGVLLRDQGYRRISEQTDLRSVNPFTGEYTVYYQPIESSAHTRYVSPTPGPQKFDTSWNKARQSSYASMPTRDSYLG